MCGRIALFTPPIRLARFLDAALAAGIDPEGRPSWNVGPQQTLFALTVDGAGDRTLGRYRWGLLPSWAKDPTLANRLFNARAETITEKPSFRSAFAKRPCVIPVDGFYEWDHREGRQRQPHYFTRRDGTPLLLAGLHETWIDRNDPDAPPRHTCTVITTTPNDDIEGIHDRMPAMLVTAEQRAAWLNERTPIKEIRTLLGAAPDSHLLARRVSRAVSNARNDGPSLIDEIPDERAGLGL